MQLLVRAIQRIQQIKSKREVLFIKKRLLATKDEESQRDLKEVEQSIHLIQAPAHVQRLAKQRVAIAASKAAAE